MTPTPCKYSDRKKSKNADPQCMVVPFNGNTNKNLEDNLQVSTAESLTSFGDLLNSAYGVLKLILQQLEWGDLLNASKVCRTWSEVAERINCERLEPQWFHLNDPVINNKKGRYSVVYASPQQYSRPALSLVFINEQANIAHCCRHMPRDGCFVPCDNHHRLMQYVEFKLQHSNCHLVGLCCTAVKASFFHPDRDPCLSSCNEELSLMVGIILPKIPHVHMSKFYIEEPAVNYEELVNEHVGPNNHVKCLLAFIGIKHRSIIRQSMILTGLIKAINNHQSVPFALGGGVVQSTKDADFHQAIKRNRGGVMCVSFSAPVDREIEFDASSVILWENARSETEIDIILGQLAKHTIQRQYRVAVRFACVSRHNKSNLELKCFKKFFPDVSLIGFEGLGEIGVAHIAQNTDEPEWKRPCVERQITHANTTIIVLLSWGKVVTRYSAT